MFCLFYFVAALNKSYPFSILDLQYKKSALMAKKAELEAIKKTNKDYLKNVSKMQEIEKINLEKQYLELIAQTGNKIEDVSRKIELEKKNQEIDEINFKKNMSVTSNLIKEYELKIEKQKYQNINKESKLKSQYEKLRDQQLEVLDQFNIDRENEKMEIERKEAKIAPFRNKKDKLHREIDKLQKIVKYQDMAIDEIKSGFQLD